MSSNSPDQAQMPIEREFTSFAVPFQCAQKSSKELAKYVIAIALMIVTITLLILFIPRPTKLKTFAHHVHEAEEEKFAWVGGVTNTSAEFRVRLGAANGILAISLFKNMSSPIQTFELEGDWTLRDPFATANLTISELPSATWFYYTLTLTAIGLDVEPDDVIAEYGSVVEVTSTIRRALGGIENCKNSKKPKLRKLDEDDDDFELEDDWVRFDYPPSSSRVVQRGKFTTFATAGEPHSFRFGVGSCARTNSNAPVFDELADAELDLFIHMGDLHYANIVEADQNKFDEAYEEVFEQPKYRRLLTSQAIAYTYDDHDFGPNNADADSATVDVARDSYRKNVPHYNLVAEPIYQSWAFGRVLFILSDIVSESTSSGTKMSESQTQWFFSELKRGRDDFKLIVWVSSKPWIGALHKTSDAWFGHVDERERISNFIADNSITSLIVVAGDAHMIALDDGENTDYSVAFSNGTARGGAGFPILQAAPLDKQGTSKGGPFSHGCHAYRLHSNSHYGIIDVDDKGGENVCVRMAGYRSDKSGPVMEYSTCIPTVVVGREGGGQGTCAIQLLPPWPLFLMVLTLMVMAFDVILYLLVPIVFPRTKFGKKYAVSRITRFTGVTVIVLTFGMCVALNLYFEFEPWIGFQLLLFIGLLMPVWHLALMRIKRRGGKLYQLNMFKYKLCKPFKKEKKELQLETLSATSAAGRAAGAGGRENEVTTVVGS